MSQTNKPQQPAATLRIRIIKATDPSAWYASHVGKVMAVVSCETNVYPSQGIPEDVYWCREGGRFNPLNWVRVSDAEVVEDAAPTAPRPSYRRACNLKIHLTAAVMTEHEAREQFYHELRRIASVINEGTTTGETGNMGNADMTKWEMDDPWNDLPPEKSTPQPTGKRYDTVRELKVGIGIASPAVDLQRVAEHIAEATDGRSQSVEAMHRIEEILEHFAANLNAPNAAER